MHIRRNQRRPHSAARGCIDSSSDHEHLKCRRLGTGDYFSRRKDRTRGIRSLGFDNCCWICLLAVLLTIAFRYWDGRTHLKMTYHVERDQISDSFLAFAQEMAPTPPWGWPSVFFKLHNSGRTAVDVVATYLKAGERHINWPSTLNLSHPMHLDPLSIRVFAIPIHQLGEILELMGFTGKVTVTWAVRDSTGKTRNKKLSIRDVKEWAETMPAHGRSD